LRGGRLREPLSGVALPGRELSPDGVEGAVPRRRTRSRRGPRGPHHTRARAYGGKLRERAQGRRQERARGHRASFRRGRQPGTEVLMKLFNPHIHMTSRTTDDYQAMAAAGIAAVLEPAFWLGQPRTHVGTFEDYFASLLGWERFRAS